MGIPESTDQPTATDRRRAELLADQTLPAALRSALAAGQPFAPIVLDAEGGWHYQGDPIEHPRVCALFQRSIERTAGGTFLLHIAPFSYPIEVADAPYEVQKVAIHRPPAAPPTVELFLSDGTCEPLRPQTLRHREGRGLYAEVKADKPSGPWLAHFCRAAYYALAEHITDDGDRFYLALGPDRYPIAEQPAER